MNRIICDICGSEYPETDDRCPICNYPRQGNEKQVAAAAAVARTKVKGGRFNSKNVKKRRRAQEKAADPRQSENPNKPLLIVIALLLAAIALVSAYIGLRFFRGRDLFPGSVQSQQNGATPTVPCTELVLEATVLDLEVLGEQKQITVMTVPGDTTDAVTYQSSDPGVATVSETGVITAVGSGQCDITITCGAVTKTCTVVCWFREQTEAPTEPPVTLSGPLSLDRSDVSCFTVNETFTLTAMDGDSAVSSSQVIWATSDPTVATVDGGVVTAVGLGTATITATCAGETAACTVRCRFDDSSWTASNADVTLPVGDSFRLTVTNDSGETADVIWAMSKEGIVEISGNTVTGRSPGTVTLTTTIAGATLTCIVRVPGT